MSQTAQQPVSSSRTARTTGAIAEAIGADLVGPADIRIDRIVAVDDPTADSGSLTFLRSRRFANRWVESSAAAAIVGAQAGVARTPQPGRALLFVRDADGALTQVLRLFAPPRPNFPPGIHPTAIVDDSATIGQGVYIGPHCTIGADSVIGDGAILVANVYIGRDVEIGAITTLHPHVSVLDRCIVGSACIFWPSVTIGADGFGYHPSPDGRGIVKIPHIGIVRIGDGVEIGANSCVDRAKFGETLIGDGTKIDNVCQVGHNVKVGRSVLICGCSGLAGSVEVGDGAMLGAATGVTDAVKIGARARTGARSAVMNDIPPGETWVGYPAVPDRDWARAMSALRRLSQHLRTIRRLAKLNLKQDDVGTDDE